MSDMPNEIYVCGVGWKGQEGFSAVSCPDTYSHQIKYVRSDLVPQWMPIETAPRDGTEIFAYLPEEGNLVGVQMYFISREHCQKEYDDPDYMEEGWYVSYCYDNWNSYQDISLKPTHWMPLPAPPQAGEEG